MTSLEPAAGALADYYAWFLGAAHGATLIYHVGDLQFDRFHDETCPTRIEDAQRLSVLSDRVRADAKEGFLLLTQRKLGLSSYEYRGTRIRQSYEPDYTASPLRADPIPA